MKNKRKTWSYREEQQLKLDYSVLTPLEMETKFKTTWHAIKLKAFKLGIDRQGNKLSAIQNAIQNINNEEFLKDYEKLNYKQMMVKYNLTHSIYYRKLKTLGIYSYKHFTEEEKQYLINNYANTPKNEIIDKLKRSWVNIKYFASRLNLIRNKEVI